MYDSAQSRDADIEAGSPAAETLILADLGGTALARRRGARRPLR